MDAITRPPYALTTSVDRGRPELAGRPSNPRDWPITGRCAPQGGNCGILRQTRWDGSMKRRTLKWHLLLVLTSSCPAIAHRS